MTGSAPILAVNGRTLERLVSALALAPKTEAIGYAVHTHRMIFFCYPHEHMTSFPFRMKSEDMAAFAFNWLKVAAYPREPDHDGDNEKGWLVRTDTWGHVRPFGHSAFVSIEPHWIQYGK